MSKQSDYNMDFVLPMDIIKSEFKKEIENEYSRGERKQRIYLKPAIKKLKQDIYNLITRPGLYNSKFPGLLIIQEIYDGLSVNDLTKVYKRTRETVNKHITSVAGKEMSKEFMERAEKIRDNFYELKKERGIVFKGEIIKRTGLSRDKIEKCLRYLREDVEFDGFYLENTKKARKITAENNNEKKCGGNTKTHKKRLNEILSIFKTKGSEIKSVGDVKTELKKRGYDTPFNTVRWDLATLRKSGHKLNIKRTGPNLGVIYPEAKKRIKKIKKIIEIVGYAPETVLFDILSHSADYSRNQLKYDMERLSLVDKKLYIRFKEKQKNNKCKVRNKLIKYTEDIIEGKLSKEFLGKNIKFGEYWFAVQTIKNNWSIHLDPELYELASRVGEQLNHVSQEQLKTYAHFKKMYEFIEESVPLEK